VSFSHDGLEGLQKVIDQPTDLIILDLMLPSMDGIEICQKIRAKEIYTPILMLTARSEEIDRVLGLEIGADDYMIKPFSVREFIARVKTIFRRSRINSVVQVVNVSKELSFEGLSIDQEKRKVISNGKKVDLSPKEFELLILMTNNPGKSYNRSRLLSLIWDMILKDMNIPSIRISTDSEPR
jgi:two-component system alkaline phosphatase synthesis response regulator PhoP